jgi:hypothetical protein
VARNLIIRAVGVEHIVLILDSNQRAIAIKLDWFLHNRNPILCQKWPDYLGDIVVGRTVKLLILIRFCLGRAFTFHRCDFHAP